MNIYGQLTKRNQGYVKGKRMGSSANGAKQTGQLMQKNKNGHCLTPYRKKITQN